jgi:hypothetical protein
MPDTVPYPAPDEPVTITIPYWVATRIRSTMHRQVLEPEGCMCIEHHEETLTKPAEAFDTVKDQIDTWYRTWQTNTHTQ